MGTAGTSATFFDLPFRSTEEEIEVHKDLILSYPLIKQMLEGYPSLAVILDKNRQIVAYNKNAERILNKGEGGKIFGYRLGEAIGCIHSNDMPAGCGTSKFCSECGAGKCNKFTRELLKSCSEECRITITENDVESALDLRVFTSVLNIDGNYYTLFSIEDIADEKRRSILEKIFFHDVLNTASTIRGISELLRETEDMEEIKEFHEHLHNSSEQLLLEIQAQRDLINAERGNLALNPVYKSVNEIISSAFNLYIDNELSREKNYRCSYLNSDVSIETDITLLIRSLGNLIKNALEATGKSGNVKISAENKTDSVLFLVNNDAVIPPEYQLQIFQRSFSTKAGAGRGIGTYSVKLLVEQYLNGKVFFKSDKKNGTTFYIGLPKIV